MGNHRVLLIGGGGREHAIAWKLHQSPLLEKLFVAPGNPGIDTLGEIVNLNPDRFDEVADFCRLERIDLVVAGPEKQLVNGIADHLQREGIAVFGPSAAAARLEGSKEFAKSFMEKYEIPTAAYRSFDSDEVEPAMEYIRSLGNYPVVLKADGLAAGKGVFICESEKEALHRLRQFREDESLVKAASRIVVEEFMEGEEASVFLLCDGHTALMLQNAQDHKRAGDGDTGLNTGGMGAYCPAPVLTSDILERVETEIVRPTIAGMQLEEAPYKGVLYVGLMITSEGPKVVEYNCRFGDPECQVILPSMKNDLLDLMIAAEGQRLDDKEIEIDALYRCCVVLASGGYPLSYEKGKEISGTDRIDRDVLLFHAGTVRSGEKLLTAGGRVLNVVGRGETLSEAIQRTYESVKKIRFDKLYHRNDIGQKGLRHLK